MIRRIAFVSGLVILNAFGFATVARAGEGGIAGSAAFTVNNSLVTGVAVSAAVGKENASAAAFNYATNGPGLQNSAWLWVVQGYRRIRLSAMRVVSTLRPLLTRTKVTHKPIPLVLELSPCSLVPLLAMLLLSLPLPRTVVKG